MRALKVIVVVLGIAVLAAFATLVAVIVSRGGRGGEEAAGARPPVHASWGKVMLDQPAGTRIQSVTASGNLIVLQLYTLSPGQDERLVVLDPATGAVGGIFVVGQR